jgi:hypothetical protein
MTICSDNGGRVCGGTHSDVYKWIWSKWHWRIWNREFQENSEPPYLVCFLSNFKPLSPWRSLEYWIPTGQLKCTKGLRLNDQHIALISTRRQASMLIFLAPCAAEDVMHSLLFLSTSEAMSFFFHDSTHILEG